MITIDPKAVFSVDVKRLMRDQYKDLTSEHTKRHVQSSNTVYRIKNESKRSYPKISVKR